MFYDMFTLLRPFIDLHIYGWSYLKSVVYLSRTPGILYFTGWNPTFWWYIFVPLSKQGIESISDSLLFFFFFFRMFNRI